MGSLPTADILEAVDTPIQEGVLDPRALAPMAALMSAGDLLLQNDLQFERYDVPDPQGRRPVVPPDPSGSQRPHLLRHAPARTSRRSRTSTSRRCRSRQPE